MQPSDVRLLGMTLARLPTRIATGLRDGAGTAREIVQTVRRLLRDELPPPQLNGPRSRFDQPASHNRVFEGRLFTLEEFKALKNAAGVTLNDIAVALVSGAMRKYLLAHNELPSRTLLATMPVNMRARGGDTTQNNPVGSMQAALHTDIEDPRERVAAIRQSIDAGKMWIETPLVSIMNVAGVLPPAVAKPLWRTYVRNKLTRFLPLGQSTVITNVPGPPFPIYCAGARMHCMYPLGLVNPGLGLFHAVFSYGGKVSVSVLADRSQMPDPEFYRACLDAAWGELNEAFLREQAAETKPAAPARRKPKAKKPPVRKKPL
jgi:WS/DGAT/MGAT family acyltransferase